MAPRLASGLVLCVREVATAVALLVARWLAAMCFRDVIDHLAVEDELRTLPICSCSLLLLVYLVKLGLLLLVPLVPLLVEFSRH